MGQGILFPDKIRHSNPNLKAIDADQVERGDSDVDADLTSLEQQVESLEQQVQEAGDVSATEVQRGDSNVDADLTSLESQVSGNTSKVESLESQVESLEIQQAGDIEADHVLRGESNVDVDLTNLESLVQIALPRLVDSLEEAFPQIYYRNKENNNIDIAGETPYLITAINLEAKTITVDQPIPYIDGLIVPDPDNKWALYTREASLAEIASVDYATRTITYDHWVTGSGAINVGEKVFFYNPFRRNKMLSDQPLLDVNLLTPACDFTSPGGVWQHSDGTYRMIINARDASENYRMYLAQSSDLRNWSFILTTPYFEQNTAPFNKSWSAGGGLVSTSNPTRINDSRLFYMSVGSKNGSGIWESGFAVIDEDFRVIEVFETAVVIPAVSNTHGNYHCGMVCHNGIYKAFIQNDAADSLDRTTYELQMGELSSGKVNSVIQVGKGSANSSWMSQDMNGGVPFVYNDTIYFIAGGQAAGTDPNELFTGNRAYGLFRENNGTWTELSINPVIGNPIEGETVWDPDTEWASDHAGNYLSPIIKDNILYLFLSCNQDSADSYVTCFEVSLKKNEYKPYTGRTLNTSFPFMFPFNF